MKIHISIDPGTRNSAIAYLVEGTREIKTVFIQKPKDSRVKDYCYIHICRNIEAYPIDEKIDNMLSDSIGCKVQITDFRIYLEDCITGRINAKTQHEALRKMVMALYGHFGDKVCRLLHPMDWRYALFTRHTNTGVNDIIDDHLESRGLTCNFDRENTTKATLEHIQDSVCLLMYGLDLDKQDEMRKVGSL